MQLQPIALRSRKRIFVVLFSAASRTLLFRGKFLDGLARALAKVAFLREPSLAWSYDS